MNEIRKAVIPAAGLGTRFLPLTKSIPKEMLPIVNIPVIHYVVEEAIKSGIEDLIIITARGKRSIEDYFDESPELEAFLEENKKESMLKMVQDISSFADIHYIRQKEPKGLGDAILRAEKHIGDEPFAVLLGDDIVKSKVPCIKQLKKIHSKYRSSIVAVEDVPKEKVSSYGIIKGCQINYRLLEIEDIVEKPNISDAPSCIGAIGRYILVSDIFDYLKSTSRGMGNEIQLTDGIKKLLKNKKVYAYRFNGIRYDTGDKIGYLKTIIDFSLNDSEIRTQLTNYLKKV